MELVSYDDDSVTIRMDRRTEFARLARVVSAAAIDPDKLDPVILMLNPDELGDLEDLLQVVATSIYE